MNGYLFTCKCNYWVLLILFNLSVLPTFAYKSKKVLLLHSYHQGYIWSDEITRGIQSGLSKETATSLSIEYMDTKRSIGQNYIEQLDRIYKTKYASTRFDLILCSDNNALDFIIDHYGEAPYTAPVVYCGVSNYNEYQLDSLPFIGVTESFNFKKEIHKILKILPGTENIYFFLDQTETGNIYFRHLQWLEKEMKNTVNLHLINNMEVGTIADFTAGLEQGSVIRYINSHKDKYGEPLNNLEIAGIIAKNASVPLLGGEISYMEKGFLGGMVNIGFEHGLEAAKLGIKLLNGTPPEELKKRYFPVPKFYINYKVMKKFNIRMGELPEDTILLYSPKTLYFKYRFQILAIGAFVIFLLLTITLLVINNVHRRKTQIQMLRAKQKAEESDKLKSAFLANMSHEIRTPLNSIVGFSGLLAERYQHDETSEKYIRYITSSTNSLLNLINDILDFSKIEVGQLEIQCRVVNINKELDNLYSIFDHELFESKKHKVSLKFSPETDDELFVKTDPIRVRQIMTNLLTNAIKFTNEGEIEFGYKLQGDELLFFCFDTGKGMHAEHKDKIFKRFVKLDSPENSYEKGTGLGLAITKNLVELLGGRIWVESEPGIGSSFYFTLPFKN